LEKIRKDSGLNGLRKEKTATSVIKN